MSFSTAVFPYMDLLSVKDDQSCAQTSNVQQLPDGGRTTVVQTEIIWKSLLGHTHHTAVWSANATIHPPDFVASFKTNECKLQVKIGF